VHAEGATDADLPGATRPLNDHPLFRAPGDLLPGYADYQGPAAGNFPAAERVHGSTVKLPVWHRDQDLHLADAYTAAITKVARHHKELLT
jgi:perosamine synthetase